jgi:hypothetical protein
VQPAAAFHDFQRPENFAAATAELFGLWSQTSGTGFILALPEALFEAAIGIWLTFKGFRPSPLIAAITAAPR